jgi:hypothetical protein
MAAQYDDPARVERARQELIAFTILPTDALGPKFVELFGLFETASVAESERVHYLLAALKHHPQAQQILRFARLEQSLDVRRAANILAQTLSTATTSTATTTAPASASAAHVASLRTLQNPPSPTAIADAVLAKLG